MKKTFPVNINGKVFYIDEDAYELLLNYLDQLRSAFSDAEGDEIVSDIESRISELFDERISAGANAIIYSDVNRVIEIMGKPSDISENDETAEEPAAEQPADDDRARQREAQEAPAAAAAPTESKKLYRNLNDKVLGGVLGGIAAYLGWDANIMRILFVVLTVITQVWPLTIIYLIAWMIMPPANTPLKVLEMQGQPVTVDSIGQSVLSSATPPPYNGGNNQHNSLSNVISNIFSVLGKCLMLILGFIGSVGALVATGFTMFFIVALIALTCFDNVILIQNVDPFIIRSSISYAPTLISTAYLFLPLCFIIPAVALAWAAASALFNCKGAAKSTIIIACVLELILIVATIVLWSFADGIRYL